MFFANFKAFFCEQARKKPIEKTRAKLRENKSKPKRSAHVSMSFHRVAVYTRRLMVLWIPEPRIIPVVWRINVIDALRNNRALVIEPKRTQLMIRLREKPF